MAYEGGERLTPGELSKAASLSRDIRFFDVAEVLLSRRREYGTSGMIGCLGRDGNNLFFNNFFSVALIT